MKGDIKEDCNSVDQLKGNVHCSRISMEMRTEVDKLVLKVILSDKSRTRKSVLFFYILMPSPQL